VQKVKLTSSGSQLIHDRIDYLANLLSHLITYDIQHEYYDQEASSSGALTETGGYTAAYFDSKFLSAQTAKLIERDRNRIEALKPQDDPELVAFQIKYPPPVPCFMISKLKSVTRLTK